MKLLDFLLHIRQYKKFPSAYLVCFRSQHNYPLLFFSLLFRWLKQHCNHITQIALDEQNQLSMHVQLSTCFLGTSLTYWLGNLTTLSTKTQKQWSTFLATYNGPHTLVFFATEDIPFSSDQKVILVTLPDAIFPEEMLKLQQLPPLSSPLNKQFIQQLIKKQQKISLDLFYLLAHYALLIGKSTDIFFTRWLDHIMPMQTSLFLLSQYFFEKNASLFFREWLQMHTNYNPQFWVVFWSEQLWRAALLVDLSRNKSLNEAKKIQFKLPFSFIKRDWKKYHFNELQHAHQFITTIDYNLKNNGSPHSLDLFYSKFFLNHFT